MPPRKITDRTLAALGPADAGLELRDASLPGFAVRVTASGRVTFSLSYRLGGRQAPKRRLSLGVWPEVRLAKARALAAAARDRIREGVDPAEGGGEAAGVAQVAGLVAAYFVAHPATPWRREQLRILTRDVLPAVGERAVATLRRGELVRLFDDLVRRGAPAMAVKARKALWQVCEWGLRRELVGRNPVRGVDPPVVERSRDRVFTPEELRRLWRELDRSRGPAGLVLALELVTAQRGGEIAGMRRSEIEGDWWLLPRERTKAKREIHAVYLGPLALALVAQARGRGDVLFAGPTGERMGPTALSRAMRRIAERAGVTDARPHDLRRTGATLLAEGLALDGRDDWLVGVVLGHTTGRRSPRVTAVYNRFRYAAEKRDAMLRLERALLEILDDGAALGPGANVGDEPAAPAG